MAATRGRRHDLTPEDCKGRVRQAQRRRTRSPYGASALRLTHPTEKVRKRIREGYPLPFLILLDVGGLRLGLVGLGLRLCLTLFGFFLFLAWFGVRINRLIDARNRAGRSGSRRSSGHANAAARE